MIRATPRGNEQGFTLLELLVSLVVLSLLAVILFESLHFGIQGWHSARRHASDVEEVATAQRFLRSRVEAIVPFRSVAIGEAVRAVSGGSDELEFTAQAPITAGEGEYRYAIRLRRRPLGADVIVRWRRDWTGRFDRVAGPEWHEEILLDNVENILFEYLVMDEVRGPLWQSTWSKPSGAPALVRVTVRFPRDDSRQWPGLVVHPRIEADPQCEFDPVSQQCRSV
jgi:general secretion pathway protein J